MNADNCKQCGARMVWATNNENGRRMPLDSRPWKSQGNISLDSSRGTYIELEPEVVERFRERGYEFYTIHFDTCPARERTPRYEETFGEQEKGIYEHAN